MKKVTVGAVAVVVGVVASVAVLTRPRPEPASHGREHERSAPRVPATAAPMETISGEVIELPGGGRGGGDAKGPGAQGPSAPLIKLRTATEQIQVHAGPPRYHSQIGLVLAKEDHIEVTGTRQGKGEHVVLVAQTIKKGDRVFRIRGENGEKLWQPNAKPTVSMTSISGEVINLAPELAENVAGRERSGMIVAIQTTSGKLAVQLGPESYRTERGLTLEMGDQLDITGWQLPGAMVADIPVMLAATIRKGTHEVRLRDEQRRALWQTD